MLSRTFDALFGGSRTFALEHRLFNAISLLTGVASLLFNGLANLGGAIGLTPGGRLPYQRVLSLTTGLLFLGCFYLARFRNAYRPLYWPFVLIMLASLVAAALGNAGTLGGLYFLVPALIIATILAATPRRMIVAVLLFVAGTAALVVVQLQFPQLVTPYERAEDRILDVGGNLLFIELFTSALVSVVAVNLVLERRTSQLLMLNILPEPIAEELKREERVRPRAYESAAVLFADCVGFTQIAEGLTAEGLIAALDTVFTRFDAIMHAHGIEKIKTIGDAYMAVGGIPTPNRTHAVDCVLAAVAMLAAVEALDGELGAAGGPTFAIRVGVHTGSLVAGVIGRSKFAYDVWGDTVNTASRMESSGEPGRVNISRETFERVEGFFVCEYRGKIAAKHKGEIDMYFVEGLRPELSAGGDGRTPNERFRAMRRALEAESAVAQPVAFES